MINLYKLFNEVKASGWIKSMRNGTGGIGYTFESLIGKPEENFPIPDFGNIEIKTCRRYTGNNVHLFSATPDGDFLFSNERVLKYLGYPDKQIPEATVFNKGFNAKEFEAIGWYKEGKVVVNREQKKIDFVARKIYGKYYPLDTSWSFNMLEDKLNLKLKYLARIIADVKVIDGTEYFHYNQIKFYRLKGFEDFISLIEDGHVKINFNIGVYRDGNRKGKIHDRGVGFSINRRYLNMLYDEIKIDLGQEVAK